MLQWECSLHLIHTLEPLFFQAIEFGYNFLACTQSMDNLFYLLDDKINWLITKSNNHLHKKKISMKILFYSNKSRKQRLGNKSLISLNVKSWASLQKMFTFYSICWITKLRRIFSNKIFSERKSLFKCGEFSKKKKKKKKTINMSKHNWIEFLKSYFQ